MNKNEQKSTSAATHPTAPTMHVVTPAMIKPALKVLCSKGGQLGVVDHMQGPITIKLNKDDEGVHHYIPLAWITRVDESVHTDRPGDQAMKEWSTLPPKS